MGGVIGFRYSRVSERCSVNRNNLIISLEQNVSLVRFVVAFPLALNHGELRTQAAFASFARLTHFLHRLSFESKGDCFASSRFWQFGRHLG